MKGDEVAKPPAAMRDIFSYGADYPRKIFDICWAGWQDDYDTMVLAPMRLIKAVLPHMRAAGRGSFVAISGIGGGQPRLPFPQDPTGLALQSFVKLLAERYGTEGLRFNTIAPGLPKSAESEFHPRLARHGPAWPRGLDSRGGTDHRLFVF
jgi:NAD(P)-dependent dehydrogenase (short-subunit alcohol dehydrogenase family)